MSTRPSASISIWSILALTVLILGVATTILMGYWSISRCAQSGQRFTIGEWHDVVLPAGRSLVYYESEHPIPITNMSLFIEGKGERYITRRPAPEQNSFQLKSARHAGMSLWEINVPEARIGQFVFRNGNPPDTKYDRAGDRIVFTKEPNRLADAGRRRKIVQATGIVCTFSLAIGLYLVHGVSASRRERGGSDAVES